MPAKGPAGATLTTTAPTAAEPAGAAGIGAESHARTTTAATEATVTTLGDEASIGKASTRAAATTEIAAGAAVALA